MRSLRWVVVLLTLLILATCGDDEPSSSVAVPPETRGPIVALHLFVSNQSFDVDPVHIEIAVDGVVVVSDTFEVLGQHNWVQFDVDLAQGEHLLTATALGGAESVSETFILDSQSYGLLEFWTDPDRGVDPFLRWIIQGEPFGFA